jgi:hypothetical protein
MTTLVNTLPAALAKRLRHKKTALSFPPSPLEYHVATQLTQRLHCLGGCDQQWVECAIRPGHVTQAFKTQGQPAACARLYRSGFYPHNATSPHPVTVDYLQTHPEVWAWPRLWDGIISPLDLQGVIDIPGVLSQWFGGVNKGGFIMIALLGGETLHELKQVMVQADTEIFGGAHTRLLPWMQPKDLGNLLRRAGFQSVVADQDRYTVHYTHTNDLWQDIKQFGDVLMDMVPNQHQQTALVDTYEQLIVKKPRPSVSFRHNLPISYRAYVHNIYKQHNPDLPATFDVLYGMGWKV